MLLPRPLLAPLGAVLMLLAGCGGGSGGPPATTTTPPPPVVTMAAQAGSAGHAGITWRGGSAGTTWRLERRAGDGGDYTRVADVDSGAGLWLDAGLAADTAYAYRLSRADGSIAATASTRTGTEAALTTAAPEPSAAAVSLPYTPATTSLRTADGSLQVDLPADSFSQAGTATLQPMTNPLADGVGPGLRLTLPERPARTLTVSLRYGADEDADEVTQDRIALRQADGSWWLLPLAAHDEAQRLLQVKLPSSLWVAEPMARALGARPSAAATVLFSDFVRVKAHKLVPAAATVRTLGHQRFVPVSIYRMRDTVDDGDCLGENELCAPSIVFRDATVPILNAKAGFQREWTLEGSTAPAASLGTLAAEPQSGAVYTAPAQVPATNPLTLRFRSVNSANGRRLVLSAKVRVAEDAWVGRLNADLGIGGQGGLIEVDSRWTLDAAQSTATRRVYRPSGTATQDYFIANSPCLHTVSPRQVTLAQARSSGQLVVDESTTPARYTLDLATIWDATLTASCPGGTTGGPYAGGHLWSAEGSVANGRIMGSDNTLGDRKWSLGRPE